MGHGFVIHFLHPSSARTLTYVTPADGPLDLGTIARKFSLDPVSVRFNGHFISRNADFISSLTWRQVLNFFESRRHSSGKDSDNPVRVEGRFLLSTPIEDANVVIPEEAALEHTHPPKRTAREAQFSLSLTGQKRLRRESETGTTSSMAEAMLFSPKLKRRQHEDTFESGTGSKRIRCEVSSDDGLALKDGEISQDQENKHWNGSKRNMTGDDVSTYTALWKRVKEIRV